MKQIDQHICAKLYNFIAKLIATLEEELDELKNKRSQSAINVKKNITDTLKKLVQMLTQMHKLSQNIQEQEEEIISTNDQEIIQEFMNRYTQ